MTGWQRMRYITGLDLPDSRKAVLWAILSRLNRDGVCWPGPAQLARDAGMSQRTLERIVPELQGAGLIDRVFRHRRSTVYTLTLETHSANLAFQSRHFVGTEILQGSGTAKAPAKTKRSARPWCSFCGAQVVELHPDQRCCYDCSDKPGKQHLKLME